MFFGKTCYFLKLVNLGQDRKEDGNLVSQGDNILLFEITLCQTSLFLNRCFSKTRKS